MNKKHLLQTIKFNDKFTQQSFQTDLINKNAIRGLSNSPISSWEMTSIAIWIFN